MLRGFFKPYLVLITFPRKYDIYTIYTSKYEVFVCLVRGFPFYFKIRTFSGPLPIFSISLKRRDSMPNVRLIQNPDRKNTRYVAPGKKKKTTQIMLKLSACRVLGRRMFSCFVYIFFSSFSPRRFVSRFSSRFFFPSQMYNLVSAIPALYASSVDHVIL